MELCVSHKLVVANTLSPESSERQITCYNVGAEPHYASDPVHFGQIDFVLVPRIWSDKVKGVHSDRSKALASHHFLVTASLCTQVPKEKPKIKEALQPYGKQTLLRNLLLSSTTKWANLHSRTKQQISFARG